MDSSFQELELNVEEKLKELGPIPEQYPDLDTLIWHRQGTEEYKRFEVYLKIHIFEETSLGKILKDLCDYVQNDTGADPEEQEYVLNVFYGWHAPFMKLIYRLYIKNTLDYHSELSPGAA